MTELIAFFLGSFLASTILPGGVEIPLYYLFQSGNHSFVSLLAVATAGNTLGGITTYLIGYGLNRSISRFPWYQNLAGKFNSENQTTAKVKQWGTPILLFSWLPIVGDPLCIAAGYFRLPMWISFLYIFLGKFFRYWILLWLFYQGQKWSFWVQ